MKHLVEQIKAAGIEVLHWSTKSETIDVKGNGIELMLKLLALGVKTATDNNDGTVTIFVE